MLLASPNGHCKPGRFKLKLIMREPCEVYRFTVPLHMNKVFSRNIDSIQAMITIYALEISAPWLCIIVDDSPGLFSSIYATSKSNETDDT